jgi:hypothetical protein
LAVFRPSDVFLFAPALRPESRTALTPNRTLDCCIMQTPGWNCSALHSTSGRDHRSRDPIRRRSAFSRSIAGRSRPCRVGSGHTWGGGCADDHHRTTEGPRRDIRPACCKYTSAEDRCQTEALVELHRELTSELDRSGQVSPEKRLCVRKPSQFVSCRLPFHNRVGEGLPVMRASNFSTRIGLLL